MTTPAPASDPPGTHTVDVQPRFADMDALAHVNNVRYLDYLDEGLAGWLEWYDVEGAVRIHGHRLGFVVPMVFGRTWPEVRTSVVGVDGDVVHVAQEMTTGETVHLRSESWLGVEDAGDAEALRELASYAAPSHEWRAVTAAERPARHTHRADVRLRDLGPDGLVRPDAIVEWFQEARVAYFMDLHTRGEEWAMVVIARTDVVFSGEVRRDDDVAVGSWVAHVGTSSFTVRADLMGDGDVLASSTVVAVCVDAATQRPVPLTPDHRAALERELAAEG